VNLATHERGCLAAGNELPVLKLRLDGGSLAVGVQLCREITFPGQWQSRPGSGPAVIDTEAISDWYLSQRRTDLLGLRYRAEQPAYVTFVRGQGVTGGRGWRPRRHIHRGRHQ
jgi:hypothetical protein